MSLEEEDRYKELLSEVTAPPRMARWRDVAQPSPRFGLRRLLPSLGVLIVGSATVLATGGVSIALVTHRGPFAQPSAGATAATSGAAPVSASASAMPTAVATDAAQPQVSPQANVTATTSAPPLPQPTAATTDAGLAVTLLDDSYTASDHRNANYGSEPKLVVDNQSPFRKIYLKFSVQGLTRSPRSVQLRLYATSAGTGFQVHPVAPAWNAWSESTITANNAPAFAAAVGYHPAFDANAWQGYDVTAIVTGNGTFTLVITGNTWASFASKEAGSGLAPQLVIS